MTHSFDCLHCQLGPEIARRLRAGATPAQVIGELLDAVSDLIASLPEEDRRTALAMAPGFMAQRVADSVEAFAEGDGIDPLASIH
jgi:hypothetical protein